MLLLKPLSREPPTECIELAVEPRRGLYRPPVELGLFVHSFGAGKGKELCGGFGDRNSKLSVDFLGLLGEDMMAAQVGGAQ
jgi:hypothetical protein